jgi:peptide/nickel transport system permease protein
MRRILQATSPGAVELSLALYLLGVGVLLFAAPALAPFSPTDFHPESALQAPGLPFLLGTDEFGRDVLSRILHGAPPTLTVALASAALGVGLGTVTGCVAAYRGGLVDEALMRLMDALMSFPALVLAMLIVVMLGGSTANVVLAIGVVFWPRSARLIRSAALDIARREFIAAARSRGESAWFILFREILPNTWSIVVVDFSLRATYGILLAASLGYLGIGVAPPTPAWGLMVRDGQQYLQIAPWLVIWPCAAIGLVSIATVLAGDRLRRMLAVSVGRLGQ